MISIVKPTKPFEQLTTQLFTWKSGRRTEDRFNKSEIVATTERVLREESSFVDGPQLLSNDGLYATNCMSLSTAAAEMKATASCNTKCTTPAFHFLLSWDANEHPSNDEVISYINRCLKQLAMDEHQYIYGVFRPGGRIYARVIVNRVHPVTFKAASIYNSVFTLRDACSQDNA